MSEPADHASFISPRRALSTILSNPNVNAHKAEIAEFAASSEAEHPQSVVDYRRAQERYNGSNPGVELRELRDRLADLPSTVRPTVDETARLGATQFVPSVDNNVFHSSRSEEPLSKTKSLAVHPYEEAADGAWALSLLRISTAPFDDYECVYLGEYGQALMTPKPIAPKAKRAPFSGKLARSAARTAVVRASPHGTHQPLVPLR